MSYGLDPARFTELSKDAGAADALLVSAPSTIKFSLPPSLFEGAEFVVTGALHEDDGSEGSVQLQVSKDGGPFSDRLWPGVPIITRPGGSAEARVKKAFAQFRDFFLPPCVTRGSSPSTKWSPWCFSIVRTTIWPG